MDPFLLLLAGLFILAVSFFAIGIYLSTRSKKRRTSHQERQPLLPLDEALQDEGISEIVQLLRDKHSGNLILAQRGVVYRSAADLNPEQRRVLSLAAGDLHTFLGLLTASQSDAATPPAHAKETEHTSEAHPSARIQKTNQEYSKAQARPSMNPVDVFTRAIASEVPKVDFKPKSITAQIDDILQESLVNTPLAARGIRLVDAPDGRVVVFVGTESYDGVGAVPDGEVKQAIHAAVTEWEKRSSRNM